MAFKFSWPTVGIKIGGWGVMAEKTNIKFFVILSEAPTKSRGGVEGSLIFENFGGRATAKGFLASLGMTPFTLHYSKACLKREALIFF